MLLETTFCQLSLIHALSVIGRVGEGRCRSSVCDVALFHLGVPSVVLGVTAVMVHCDFEVVLLMVFPVAFRPEKVSSCRLVWALG